MSKKCLIVFLFIVAHAVNATYLSEEEFGPLSLEEVTDTVIDELKSVIDSEVSHRKKNGGDKAKPELHISPSRIEDLWLEPDSEPSSLFDDPDENDALHSRDYSNSNKREEYYENLEKKSLRTTYAPPPRKNFYTTPVIVDSSASEEFIHEERGDNVRRRPLMVEEGHSEEYYPQVSSPLRDAERAESYHLIDSLDVVPVRAVHQSRSLQTPPWRLSKVKPYSKRPSPPEVYPNERSKIPESIPAIPMKAPPPMKHHRTYKMAPPPVPRRPVHMSAPKIPVHMGGAPKIHFKDEGKFRTLTKSKPWVTEYTKEPVPRKFPAKEEKAVERSGFGSAFRKATRQQFHEQGTRGPHSYKFGYNTGDHENPMARYEERDADGIVRGSYSYIDPRGHKQVVHYESHPKFGFKTKLSSSF